MTAQRSRPAPATERRLVCFTLEQWALWRTPHNSMRVAARNACEDCTHEYQSQMLAAQRCQYPGTVFYRDADGFISGHRPPKPTTEEPL